MRRIWVAMAVVALGALTGAPLAAQQTQPKPGTVLLEQPRQRPYTETMRDMEQRDARFRAEVAAGLRPPPKRLIVIREHEPAGDPEPAEDEMALLLPAAFRDPDPTDPAGRAYQVRSPQSPGASFVGLSLQDEYSMGTGYIPPDTCGAIGPSHFMEVVNGAVAVYTRTGTRLSRVTLNSFLAVSVGGVSYPRGGSFDPRIIYDRRSSRWFACALEYGSPSQTNNHVILAVSRTSDPTGTWDKYVVQIGKPTSGGVSYFTDYDTLGVDDNGVYIAATVFNSVGGYEMRFAAIRKGPLIATPPSMGSSYIMTGPGDFYSTGQPALNLDAVATDGRAWFVGSSTASYSNIRLSYLTWPASGAPTVSSTITVTSPAFGAVPSAPAKGSSINIDAGDVRMQPAMIRGNRMWTCRAVGVNSVGTASGADRAAIEWFELDVTSTSPSIVQRGRLYDGAASGFVHFYYPSIAANGSGHAAVSFSDSNSTRWVAAETTGRLASDASGTLQSIMNVQPGQNSYTLTFGGGANRWGDYSHSSVDPNDDLSIWTIQEYATSTANVWGTWIMQLRAPAPTLNNPAGSGAAGTTSVVLNLTGTGFFDPGPGFPSRLAVQLTGGTVNGISNYQVTYSSPTSASVTFDIAANATAGSRTIVLTNPDGQQASVAGFTVTSGNNTSLAVAPASGSIGATVALSATLTRTSDGLGLSGRTISFTVGGSAAGSAATNASGMASLNYAIPESLGVGSATIGASFAGDGTYLASTGNNTLTVTKAATSMSVPDATGRIAEAASLSATLTRATDGAPLAGRSVAFMVAGSPVGAGPTNASGVATVVYVVPEALGAGAKALRADFGGDATHLASFGTATLTVQQAPTTTAAVDATGRIAEVAALSATLTRTVDSAPLPGRTIAFQVDGSAIGGAATDAGGVAALNYAVPEALGAGAKALRADFGGDATHLASFGTATLTVQQAPTTTVAVDATGRIAEVVALSATLTRTVDSAPLAGRTIGYQVEGSGVGSAITNAAGVASLNYAIPEALAVGAHALRADFGGDVAHLASFGTATLTVSQGLASLVVPNVSGQMTATVDLSATLTRTADAAEIEGRTVSFTVDGSSVGDATTSAAGTAIVAYAIPLAGGPGNRAIGVAFAGDAAYEGATGSGTLEATKASTTTTVADKTGSFLQTVTLTAALHRATDGAPLEGRVLAFLVEGTSIGDATTDTAGDGSVQFIPLETLGGGAKTIEARFAGDSDHAASTGTGVLTVLPWPTALAVGDAAGMVSQTVVLSAQLTRSDTSAPLEGRSISFLVAGTSAGTASTNAGGTASLSYAIPDTIGSGALTITGAFAGDNTHAACSGSGTLTVTKASSTMFGQDRTGTITEQVGLRAYLRRVGDLAWVQGRTIRFLVGGTQVGTAVTGATGTPGRADLNWVITDGPATRTITTEFDGDGAYNASSANATLTCQSWGTKMVTFNRTARITDRTELKARLLRSDNVPVYAKSVRFYVDGTFIIARSTTVDGYASYPFYDVPDGAGAGVRTITCEWQGDGGYAAITRTATLTVLKALPYLWVLSKTAPQGSTISLYAYFRRLYDYQKQAAKPVVWSIDGTPIHTMSTDGNGVASFPYRSTQTVGDHTMRCEFSGDAWLDAGYGQATLRLY